MTFEEKQPVPKAWSLAAFAPAAIVVVAVVTGDPAPAPVIVVFGAVTAAFLLWLWNIELITQVSEDTVTLRYRGLLKTRRIPISSIRRARARAYRPLLEYGGWGIKLGPAGWAYNVSGRQGVQLELDGARPLLIGSRRAEDLARAITASAHYRPAAG